MTPYIYAISNPRNQLTFMPRDYVEIATKGHPLMAFWTLAAMGYVYITDPNTYRLFYFLLTIVTASVAYKELSQLVDMVGKLSGKYSRGRWGNQSKQKRVAKLISELLSRKGLGWGSYIIATNAILAVFIYLYYILPYVIIANPDHIMVGLFVLPLIWFVSLVWTAIALVSD